MKGGHLVRSHITYCCEYEAALGGARLPEGGRERWKGQLREDDCAKQWLRVWKISTMSKKKV